MAERLPKYRPLGVSIPTVPTVDYTATGRVRAGVYDSIASALDRVSDFAFKKLEAKAKSEAVQYAFDNPITVEQLQSAKAAGMDLDDIIGDPNTVFGATLRATTGKIMRTDLESAYRTQIVALQKEIESPDFRPEDLASINERLRSAEIGYTEALADIDPSEAMAFRATSATLGSSVYKTALETVNKKRALQLRVNAQSDVDAFPDAIRATIKATEFSGNKEDFASNLDFLNRQLDIHANSLRSALVRTGDYEFAETQIAGIQETIDTVKKDVLSEYALTDEFAASPQIAIRKILNGDFGKYSAIYDEMTETERAELRQNIRTEYTAQDSANEDLRRNEIRKMSSQVATISRQIMTADEDTRRDLFDQLYRIATDSDNQAITASAIRGFENDLKEKTPSNYKGNLLFRTAIQNGEVTQENFEFKRVEFGVTAKDAVSLFDKMLTVDKSGEAEILKIAKRASKIVNELNITEDQATEFEAFLRKVEVTYEQELTTWDAEGRPLGMKPNKPDVAQRLFDEHVASEYTKNIKTEVTVLNDLLKNIVNDTVELNEYSTEQDIDDLNLSKHPKPEEFRKELKLRLRRIKEDVDGRGVFAR